MSRTENTVKIKRILYYVLLTIWPIFYIGVITPLKT